MDPQLHFAGHKEYFGGGMCCGIVKELIYTEIEVFFSCGCHICCYGTDGGKHCGINRMGIILEDTGEGLDYFALFFG